MANCRVCEAKRNTLFVGLLVRFALLHAPGSNTKSQTLGIQRIDFLWIDSQFLQDICES